MKKVKELSEIENGDVLGEPVINSFGLLLLPVGVPLNDKQIRMLKMWNIKQVTVQLELDNYDSWLSDDLLSYSYRIFAERCLWSPSNENEDDLYNLGVVYEARKVMDSLEKKMG